MRGRKLLVVVLAVLVAVGAFVLWPRPDRITRENCERIREGMSLAEVEAILGGPPGDYRTVLTQWDSNGEAYLSHPPVYDPGCAGNPSVPIPVSEPAMWEGNTGIAFVDFSTQGAESPTFHKTCEVPQSRLDNLLWRAKRQWRKWFP
jgi:hypothetical protein